MATEVGCWAHTRRKFLEAEDSDPDLARGALDLIGRLYGVEREAKNAGLDAEGRLILRRDTSAQVLKELEAYLGMVEAKVLPKSPLGKAVGYAQNQWKALCVYTTDGRLAIDNNAAERALRAFAVGRKNWLFVQTLAGGKRAVILMTLVMTAKAIGINPAVYLRDVLQRISTETDVAKLTPHGWQDHFGQQVKAEHDAAIARLAGR